MYHFDRASAEKLVLRPDQPNQHINHKAGSIGSGHLAEEQDFLHRVAAAIARVEFILITGLATAKTELVKHLHRHEPRLVEHIAGIDGRSS